MKHFIRYIGGKSKLTEWITQFFCEHNIYVEVFGGAGNIMLKKPKSNIEVYNDIWGDLVNAWMVVKEQADDVIKELSELPCSRDLFEKYKTELKNEPEEKGIQRAIKFIYVNQLSFSGLFKNYRYDVQRPQIVKSFRETSVIKEIQNRFKHVNIENLDFQALIEKYDTKDTLFYCDPPYFGKEDLYQGGFNYDDHKRLVDTLSKIKGRVIVSYYDFKELSEWYAGWYFHTKKFTVHAANSKNSGDKRNQKEEVLILNYKDGEEYKLF